MDNASPKRPTSHDVARAANVSQATVSLVLSGRGARIGPATRERVLEAARTLGYTVSTAGRALSTGRTGRVGFVPFDPKNIVHNAYFHRVLTGLIDSLADAGHDVLLFARSTESESALAAEILGQTVDAAVLLGRYRGETLTRRLVEAGFPTVCAAYRPEGPAPEAVIDVDKGREGRLMAEALAALGHTRVALVARSFDCSWNDALKAGLQGLLEVVPVSPEWVKPSNLRHERVTGLVYAEEVFAHNDLQSLSKAGLRIPEDLSIVSARHLDTLVPSGLAGVIEPVEEVGRAAGEAAARLLRGAKVEPLTVLGVEWGDGMTLGPAAR